jgi:hypothetical protein
VIAEHTMPDLSKFSIRSVRRRVKLKDGRRSWWIALDCMFVSTSPDAPMAVSVTSVEKAKPKRRKHK